MAFGDPRFYTDLEAITPGATDLIEKDFRAIMATGDGDVTIINRNDLTDSNPITIPLIAGVPLPIGFRKVLVAGTTATGLLGLK